MCGLTILTHTADKPVVTTNQGHAIHKVNSPPLEFSVRQWQQLQEASRQGVNIFDALANSAALDKCSNMLRQLGLPEALQQCRNGFLHTQVCRTNELCNSSITCKRSPCDLGRTNCKALVRVLW